MKTVKNKYYKALLIFLQLGICGKNKITIKNVYNSKIEFVI